MSGVPRIFPSFHDFQGEEHKMKFRSRLGKDSLIFKAEDGNSRTCCVKIVYHPYGEEVHRMLGRHNMAPQLVGISRIDDGPTMIVMKMFDDSWQSLYTFAQRHPRWRMASSQRY